MVLFCIKRTKVVKDGLVPIYARVTISKQLTEFGLQKGIEDDQEDNKKRAAFGYSKKK